MVPVPRVSVRNSERYPNRPRLGIRNESRTRPMPGFRISLISARRGPSFSITAPLCSSATSIISPSYGSHRSPPRPPPADARIPHPPQPGPAGPQLFPPRAHVLLGDVDHQLLVRLQPLPRRADPGDDPRPRHLELVPFAPHR